MSANPTVVPVQVDQPTPFNAAIFAEGWEYAGSPAKINPALVDATGGTQLQSIVVSYSNANTFLVTVNAPNTFLWTVKWFLSPSPLDMKDMEGNPWSIDASSLFVKAVQDGASAFTPVVVPTVMGAVFGLYRGNLTWSDGVARPSWSLGSGTTYKPGQAFFAGAGNPNTTYLNGNAPSVLPPLDVYEVVEVYMGQAIVQIGGTAALPLNG